MPHSAATDSSAHLNVALNVIADATAVREHHGEGHHAFGLHAFEALGHLRIAHRRHDSWHVPDAPGVLLVAEAGPVEPQVQTDLEQWVRHGGVLILTDPGLCLAELAGVSPKSHGNGLVALTEGDWPQLPTRPLRAINGHALVASVDGLEVLGRWDDDGTAAMTRRTLGDGEVICFGVALWETIVRILQGYPVVADHAPAADGSAPMDEGILKCEDGMALDVDHDRRMPPGEPELTEPYAFGYPPPCAPPIFDLPQSDLWVSVFAQAVWASLDRTAGGHGWLHYWPAGVPAVAHMSHDSDGNDDADGQAALDAFAEAGVEVTWCQVYRDNSYSPEIYRKISEAGHEHALHYNAMDDADIAQWGWDQIRDQYAWAQQVTGVEDIVSNKNHYTRWEGWTEFYLWCEQLGIQIDESRGPSKLGTVGFPFGTAHVGFPMGDVNVANRPMDVVNLPLHTQDLAWAGHISCRDVILDGVMEVHGVAHFLYHGPHLRGKPATRKSCAEVAQLARDRGMPWWTARQINDWERARRGVEVRVAREDSGSWVITTESTVQLDGVGLMVTIPDARGAVTAVTEEGSTVPVTEVVRHGRRWYEITADLVAGAQRWRVTSA